MAVQMREPVPERWRRAMERATADHLHAVRINDRLYAVRSVSQRGTGHLVRLDATRRIASCDCKGWGGRELPCKHAAAVAKRLLREGNQPTPQPAPRPADPPVVEARTGGRSQLFREG